MRHTSQLPEDYFSYTHLTLWDTHRNSRMAIFSYPLNSVRHTSQQPDDYFSYTHLILRDTHRNSRMAIFLYSLNSVRHTSQQPQYPPPHETRPLQLSTAAQSITEQISGGHTTALAHARIGNRQTIFSFSRIFLELQFGYFGVIRQLSVCKDLNFFIWPQIYDRLVSRNMR